MTHKTLSIAIALALFALFSGAAIASDYKPLSDVENHTAVPEEDIVSLGPTELPEIKTIAEAETAITLSAARPVFVFKHSTTCSISKRASERLAAYVKKEWPQKDAEDAPKFVWLKVREARPVSNYLENRFDVKHESPQILLIDKGKVVWHDSHDDITAEALSDALASLGAGDEPKQP